VKLDDTSIVPKLGIGWQHAFNRFAPDQVLTLQNAAQDFTVQGASLGQDSAVVQAGLGRLLLSPLRLLLVEDNEACIRLWAHAWKGQERKNLFEPNRESTNVH
jgi:hypothetical protein